MGLLRARCRRRCQHADLLLRAPVLLLVNPRLPLLPLLSLFPSRAPTVITVPLHRQLLERLRNIGRQVGRGRPRRLRSHPRWPYTSRAKAQHRCFNPCSRRCGHTIDSAQSHLDETSHSCCGRLDRK